MYGNVDNIDLWVAGLAEDHLPNSSLGRTFTAILVDQFTRTRDGDRFWYENALAQNIVREINNTTLADIVRRNTSLTKLQADVFFFNEATVIIDSANSNLDEEPQPPTLEADSTPQTSDQGRPDRPNRACPPRTPCPPPQRPGGPPPPPRRR